MLRWLTKEQVSYGDMPDLEKWVLHRIATDDRIRGIIYVMIFTVFFLSCISFVTAICSLYFEIEKTCCRDLWSTGRRPAEL